MNMKKYNKPILDIVQFDNLDVVTMSDPATTTVADEVSPIVQQNESELLNSVETSSTHADITETSAPVEGDQLVESIPESTPVEEETSDESESDTAETPDDDQVVGETVSEDEVE